MNKKNRRIFFLLFTLIFLCVSNTTCGWRNKKRARKTNQRLVAQKQSTLLAQNDHTSSIADPYRNSQAKTEYATTESDGPVKSITISEPTTGQHIITNQIIAHDKPATSNTYVTTEPIIDTSNTNNTLLPLELQTKGSPETRNSLVTDNTKPSYTELSSPEQDLQKQSSESEEEKIEFHFEDTDLQTLVSFIEDLFNITFITDDMIQPMPQGSHSLKGNKITFKTNKLLSKKEAWDRFITFLSMAGFAVVPDGDPHRFKIKTIDAAKKSPLTTYIGVNPTTLPDNDELIRYVYFVENKIMDTIKTILEKLRSTASDLIILTNHNAFILTDKSYNIKTLMQIIKELDKVSMPQSMSVLKLRRADAVEVKNLYETLIGPTNTPQQFFQARKQPSSLYFPENTTIIAEPRTNSLILLGTKESISKIEEFIIKNIDIELDIPYSPLYVYQLKYANATAIASIMTEITRFGDRTTAGQHGGVRGVDKFMRPITFVPEEITNRLIIKGHYDDYLASKNIIEKLDSAQPQVAIEVLILSVNLTSQKQLGTQIRSKDPGPGGIISDNVKFQTSGLYQTQQVAINRNAASTGVTRLLGNLLNLATGAPAGNTIISLGSDAFGVWGIFQALQTAANAQIVSNPFLIATNKTAAKISVGETRRVQTGTVFSGGSAGDRGGTPTFGNEPANLTVEVTPQINSDGMIVLDLTINITNFTNPNEPTSATKAVREINTSTIVANKEVLALGGLIRNNVSNSARKTPVLGNIPVLGWLFKNQSKTEDKDNLLILVSTRIIEPHRKQEVQRFNTERIDDYHGTLTSMNSKADNRDPIHRLFFAPGQGSTEKLMEDFLLKRAHLEDTPAQPKKLLSRRKTRRLRKRDKNHTFEPYTTQIPTTLASHTPISQQVTQHTTLQPESPHSHATSPLSYREQIEARVPMPQTKTAYAANITNTNTVTKGITTTKLASHNQQPTPPTSALQDAIKNKKRANLSLTTFFNEGSEHVC